MKQLFQYHDTLYLVVRAMPLHQFHDKTGAFNNEKLKTHHSTEKIKFYTERSHY